jgi:hypothetical protein
MKIVMREGEKCNLSSGVLGLSSGQREREREREEKKGEMEEQPTAARVG